jgi:hypothetical protein
MKPRVGSERWTLAVAVAGLIVGGVAGYDAYVTYTAAGAVAADVAFVGVVVGVIGVVVVVTGAVGVVNEKARGLVRRRGGGRVRAGAGGGAGRSFVPLGWWRVLCMVSWVMPRGSGRRWLGEAESFVFEVAAEGRRAALRSLVLSAPETAAVMWWGEVSRRARLAVTGRDGAGRGWT